MVAGGLDVTNSSTKKTSTFPLIGNWNTNVRISESEEYDLKIFVLWDITPRNPLKVDRRFEGNYHFHFQGRRINQEGD
jgi:hypothetical protein